MTIEDNHTNVNSTPKDSNHPSNHKLDSSKGKEKATPALKLSKGKKTRFGKKQTVVSQSKEPGVAKIKKKIEQNPRRNQSYSLSNGHNKMPTGNERKVSVEGSTKKRNMHKKIHKGKARNQSYTKNNQQHQDEGKNNQYKLPNDTSNHDSSITQDHVENKSNLDDTNMNMKHLNLSDEKSTINASFGIKKNHEEGSKSKKKQINSKKLVHADVSQSQKGSYEGDGKRSDERKVIDLSARALSKNRRNQKSIGTHTQNNRNAKNKKEMISSNNLREDKKKGRRDIDSNHENSMQLSELLATSGRRIQNLKKSQRKKNKSQPNSSQVEDSQSNVSNHDIVFSLKSMDLAEEITNVRSHLDQNTTSVQIKPIETDDKENVDINNNYSISQNHIHPKNNRQESVASKDTGKKNWKGKKGKMRKNKSNENKLTRGENTSNKYISTASTKRSVNNEHTVSTSNGKEGVVVSEKMKNMLYEEHDDPSKLMENDFITTNAAGAEILYRLAHGCSKECTTESTSSVTSFAEIMSSPEETIYCDETNHVEISRSFGLTANEYVESDISTQVLQTRTPEIRSHTNMHFVDNVLPTYNTISPHQNVLYNQIRPLNFYSSAPTNLHYPSHMHPLSPTSPYPIQYHQTNVGGTVFFTPTITVADQDYITTQYPDYNASVMYSYATQNQMLQTDQINTLDALSNSENSVNI